MQSRNKREGCYWDRTGAAFRHKLRLALLVQDGQKIKGVFTRRERKLLKYPHNPKHF